MTIDRVTLNDPEARSADPVAENVAALKALFPAAVADGRIDFDTLRQLLGDEVDDGDERYGLNWPGKRRARRLALTPSTGTLRPAREDSVDWDSTRNLMIEGDNLEVLKLLRKSYARQVKLIYIDPPYNTGSDLVYPDNYTDSLSDYFAKTDQRSGDQSWLTSNREDGGRFHTNWLNMIYPRLQAARSLLREDGCIAVSIGDQELSSLIQVCDEVFGEENFITICSRVMKTGGQKGVHFSPSVDYIAIYASNIAMLGPFREPISENVIQKVYTRTETEGPRTGQKFRAMGLYQAMLERRANQRYYIECPDGQFVIPPGNTFPAEEREGAQVSPGDEDGVWRWSAPRFAQERKNGNVEFIRSDRTSLVKPDGTPAHWNVYYKIWLEDRLEDGQLPGNILEKFQSRHSSAELKGLDIPFDYAKPSALIKYLMSLTGIGSGDIVLDFFAGSATTGHAAMELSAEHGADRRFICVQLPEPTQEESEEAKKGFANIAEISKARLRSAAQHIRKAHPDAKADLGFRVYKLATSNLRAWEPGDDLAADLLAAADNIVQGRTEDDLLTELLLKQGIDLTEPMLTETIAGVPVHAMGGGVLVVCLAPVTAGNAEALAEGIADWILRLKPVAATTVFFKDSGFENDVAKANVAAILEQRLEDQLLKVRSL